MKSKYFKITPIEINNDEIHRIDLNIFISSYIYKHQTITENKKYYPSQVTIKNRSGIRIGVIAFSNCRDKELFCQNPEFFDWIPIDGRMILGGEKGERIETLLIKKWDSNVAIKDIEIICLGYISE